MKLDGVPGNVLMRRHWWSDDVPRWLNRLAHYTCCWVTASVLVSLPGWLGRGAIERSNGWVTMAAVTGGVAYGVGIIVYKLAGWRSSGRPIAPGA